MRIFYEFMLKRRFGSQRKGKKKKTGAIVLNNGQIGFSYPEADRLGYPCSTFHKAIDKLIEVGLIDVHYQGQGGILTDTGDILGESSLYGISERWKDYGKDNFVVKKRKVDTRKDRGWSAYHSNKNKSPHSK